ncbi:hypothetical protein [Halovivax sp.]|uniref:hypothetical protein n=1 Tax=Halovivax sp. TaxID=1935978 RepID=UPI0025BF5203|nr:hypothetical protein [Halovivax sp.]
MVEERVTDGRRIAELLASEIDGREDGGLGRLSVTNADPDVEPSADGARAYDVTSGESSGDARRVATVHVHEDRAHVSFREAQETAHETAADVGLRTRPKAVRPPQTLVFVESGAEVKRATDVLAAVGDRVSD